MQVLSCHKGILSLTQILEVQLPLSNKTDFGKGSSCMSVIICDMFYVNFVNSDLQY